MIQLAVVLQCLIQFLRSSGNLKTCLFYLSDKDGSESGAESPLKVQWEDYSVFKSFCSSKNDATSFPHQFNLYSMFESSSPNIPIKSIFLNVIKYSKSHVKEPTMDPKMFYDMVNFADTFNLNEGSLSIFAKNLLFFNLFQDQNCASILNDIKAKKPLVEFSATINMMICTFLKFYQVDYIITDGKLIVIPDMAEEIMKNDDYWKYSEHYTQHSIDDKYNLDRRFNSVEIYSSCFSRVRGFTDAKRKILLALVKMLTNGKHVISADFLHNLYEDRLTAECCEVNENPLSLFGITRLTNESQYWWLESFQKEHYSSIQFLEVSFGFGGHKDSVDDCLLTKFMNFVKKYLCNIKRVKLTLYPSACFRISEVLDLFKNANIDSLLIVNAPEVCFENVTEAIANINNSAAECRGSDFDTSKAAQELENIAFYDLCNASEPLITRVLLKMRNLKSLRIYSGDCCQDYVVEILGKTSIEALTVNINAGRYMNSEKIRDYMGKLAKIDSLKKLHIIPKNDQESRVEDVLRAEITSKCREKFQQLIINPLKPNPKNNQELRGLCSLL